LGGGPFCFPGDIFSNRKEETMYPKTLSNPSTHQSRVVNDTGSEANARIQGFTAEVPAASPQPHPAPTAFPKTLSSPGNNRPNLVVNNQAEEDSARKNGYSADVAAPKPRTDLGPTPKIGEIVVLNHAPTAHGGHRQSPAIVHSSSSEGLMLTVFTPNGTSQASKVKQGDKAGEWNYVKNIDEKVAPLVLDSPTAPRHELPPSQQPAGVDTGSQFSSQGPSPEVKL